MTSIRYYLASFGCQMNKLDGELLEADFRARGWEKTASEGDADLILYLTCSVRRKPEEKVFSRVAQIRKRNGRPVVCVAGCMAQRLGRAVAERAGNVDLVLGTGALARCADALARLLAGQPGPLFQLEMTPGLPHREPSARPRPHQAFIAVARGCSKRCAYCVVPDTRGPEASRPVSHVTTEAASLLDAGVSEITLIAQNIARYGRDLTPPSSLASLLREVHALKGLRRLRFLTSHPADLDTDTIEAVADLPRLCFHLHLPAQSGSNRILEAMGRGYTRESYLELVRLARDRVPEMEFTSDFIVGFPGETPEDFEATASLVETVGFQNIFAFQYSPRPGTPAASLEDTVPPEEKRRRNHVLLDVQKIAATRMQAEWVGRTVEILVEGPSKRDSSRYTGRTPGNRIVVFPMGEEDLAGRFTLVRIESVTPLTLFGFLVKEGGNDGR